MATAFRTMHAEHKAVLVALSERMTYRDVHAKMPHLERSRVLGILNALQHRGLAENRNGMWSRTQAGDNLATR